VVYTTSRELVGDLLRDRLSLGRVASPAQLRLAACAMTPGGPRTVLRGVHTVFVDEADQVLIDDAVTPLLISAPRDNPLVGELCRAALAAARELTSGVDYTIDAARHDVRIDRRVLERQADEGWHPLLRVPRWRQEWLRRALEAQHLFSAGKHYFVREGKVVLIDEATGRATADRSLGEGMHQMIEAKEGLPVTAPAETMAGLSFQRFFRQVPRLAGLTGTARDNRAEFWRLYRLPVLAIPTRRPSRRSVEIERGFADEAGKWRHVVATVQAARAQGQPVLIGTRTVAASEALAAQFTAAGIKFALLNAVRNEQEADIVAGAGQAGCVTIATNMAGRGTDIVPSGEALAAGGLRVIATERHAARRIDRQLHGRCARQGQPGAVEPLVSWEDEVLRHHVPGWVRRPGTWWLRRGGRGAEAWLRWWADWAQSRAESAQAKRRLSVLRRDKWLDENLGLRAVDGPSGLRRAAPSGRVESAAASAARSRGVRAGVNFESTS
jgi:preprotein translocase subunit SecA